MGRLSGYTFIELVVTMLLLALFAVIAFPLYWGANKASASFATADADERAKLQLITELPRFSAQVQPPYWTGQDRVYSSADGELRAAYFGGKKDDSLSVKVLGGSSLVISTPSNSLRIGNLPGLVAQFWTRDDRIIGLTVSWSDGQGSTREFHTAWGSFPL